MNILHITTKDTGGAAIGALRIHDAINNHENKLIHSKMLLLWQNSQYNLNDNIVSYQDSISKLQLKYEHYQAYIRHKIFKQLTFSKASIYTKYYYSPYHPEDHELVNWADIIHLHWTNGFVNPLRFFEKIRKPIVVTFHDMTPFSGGNPYESGIFENKLTKFKSFLEKKKKTLNKSEHIYGHATSIEFMNLATKKYRTFKQSKTFYIPIPLPTELYNLIPKDDARRYLKIEATKPILVFVAADVNNTRKGLKTLLENNLTDQYTLLVAGSKHPNISQSNPGIIQLGRLSPRELNFAYSAADLFVTPAIEEAFGQTAIEALYSGTPVVAFPTAGAKNIVKNGTNGFLSKDFNQETFFHTIEKALAHNFNYMQISMLAKQEYNPISIGKLFTDKYQQILNEFNKVSNS